MVIINIIAISMKIIVVINFTEFAVAGVIDRYDRFTYIHVQFTVHTFHIFIQDMSVALQS